MLPKINIRDSNFFNRANPERKGTFFEWSWDKVGVESDVTVFTDFHIREGLSSKSKCKIAWIVEPPCVDGFAYDHVKSHINSYDAVFTFCNNFMHTNPKVRWYPLGGCWIHKPDRRVDPKKKKLISMIASTKHATTGQKLRIEVMERYKGKIDFMGRGHAKIQNKKEGLLDYRYSIAIENSRVKYYFTEKLIDCFMTGTVPIYWGCPDIGRFFDLDGMILFENSDDLERKLKTLSEEDFRRREKAVRRNYKIAEKLLSIEDNLWNCGFQKILWEHQYGETLK
jgi:hypothetical protein